MPQWDLLADLVDIKLIEWQRAKKPVGKTDYLIEESDRTRLDLIANHKARQEGQVAEPWHAFLDQIRADRSFAQAALDAHSMTEDAFAMQLSALVALALLRGKRAWPPPSGVVNYIVGMAMSEADKVHEIASKPTAPTVSPEAILPNAILNPDDAKAGKKAGKKKLPQLENAVLRVPEFAYVSMLRWGLGRSRSGATDASEMDTLDKDGQAWVGNADDICKLLKSYIHFSVASCIATIKGYLWKLWEVDDAIHWTEEAFVLFVRLGRKRCLCVQEAKGEDQGKELTENATRKLKSCLAHHSEDAWDATKSTFWMFVQKAIKGFVGPFQAGGFTSGMLYALFHARSEARIQQAHLAHYVCSNGHVHWSDPYNCPECPEGGAYEANKLVVAKPALILPDRKDEDTLFRDEVCWTCAGAECFVAVGTKGKQLRHVHPVNSCNERCPCDPPAVGCDECNRCHLKHPTGRQRKTRLVYFFTPNGHGRGGPNAEPPVILSEQTKRDFAASIRAKLSDQDQETFDWYEETCDAAEIAEKMNLPVDDVMESIGRIQEAISEHEHYLKCSILSSRPAQSE